MEYLLLIHRDAKSVPQPDDWTDFIARAQASGMFRGGSQLGARETVGARNGSSSANIAGFMRFEAGDKAALLDLLQAHPVVRHGGSIELCEMPES